RVRWEPGIAVSALTGAGLDELRSALQRVADDLIERPAEDLFRLPIDRVFAVAGAGTVVTGTTWTGTVAVGDAVRLLPLEREVRVRSIEVHGQAADRAVPGRRTALALVGVERGELARGDVAVTGAGWRATTMLDAAVELLSTARKPIGSRTRLRVHLGTAEVLARVVQVRSIGPGERGLARLVDVLRRYHKEHPIDPGMSLQALRAAVGAPAPPPAVLDAVLEVGMRAGQLEVTASVARLGGWHPAFDARTSDLRDTLARRLVDARWEVPTLGELEREFPGAPIRALLAHLAREGGAEQIDQERYAAPQAVASFRSGLEAALSE